MKIIKASQTFVWAFRQVFLASPLGFLALMLIVLMQGFIPGLSLYVIRGIIDWVIENHEFPFILIGLWGGLFLAEIVTGPVVAILRLQLNEKILAHCHIALMEKTN